MPSLARIESRVENSLSLAFLNLETYLRDQLDELHTGSGGLLESDWFNITRMEELWSRLRPQMEALGYRDAILDQLSGLEQLHYEVLEEAKKWVQPGTDYPVEFRAQTQSAVTTLLQGADAELIAVADKASSEVEQLLRRSTLGGVKYGDLITAIKDKLGSYRHQAISLAVTTLHSFNSHLVVSHAEKAGCKWYAYLGPDDRVIRPWCDHWVGTRGTMAMFEATAKKWGRDKQPPGIRAWRGGFHCRHGFSPLFGKAIEKYPIGPRASMAA